MSPRLLPAGGELRRVLTVLGEADSVVWEAETEPGRFLSVSGAVERLLGHDGSAFLEDDRFWIEHVHPDDRERAAAAWRRAAAGDRLDVEYRFATEEGDERWLWHVGQLVPG